MKNLNEMKSKELKEMAKELGVKNWWSLKKNDLINEIAIAIGDKEDEGEEVNVDEIVEAAIETADEETKVPGEDYEATLIDDTLVMVERTEDIAETHEDASESIETESHETNQDEPENEPDDDVASPENVEEKPTPKRGALIAFNGKEQNICAWAKELGISPNTLYGRIYKMGWTVEKAFTTPARSK